MEAKINQLIESVSSFFSAEDQIPWCERDIIVVSILFLFFLAQIIMLRNRKILDFRGHDGNLKKEIQKLISILVVESYIAVTFCEVSKCRCLRYNVIYFVKKKIREGKKFGKRKYGKALITAELTYRII